MNESDRTKPLSLFHQFLFSIVIIAPFYNLIKRSELKMELIAGLLIILTFLFHRISLRAGRKFNINPGAKERMLNKLRKIESTKKGVIDKYNYNPVESRLRKLKKLKNSGLISEKEYSDKKREILEKL